MALPTGPRQTPPPAKTRLSRFELAEFIGDFDAPTRRLVTALRRTVLTAAPGATEALRFRTLCYFDPTVAWGAIGGNICLIEAKQGKTRVPRAPKVFITFILGSTLPDPGKLLSGSSKFKRIIRINSLAEAQSPRLRSLISASAAQARARAES